MSGGEINLLMFSVFVFLSFFFSAEGRQCLLKKAKSDMKPDADRTRKK